MPSFKLIQQTDDSYCVEGDLTFASLIHKEIKSISFLSSEKTIAIDLAKINSADSAGLALLIEWIKQSKKSATRLVFKNIPNQIITLAALSEIDLNADFLAKKY